MAYDVIVVGARCAGAPTAMLLARKGYHVLLVDRAKFPSDIPHGHMIHRDGPMRLHNWGLLDRIVVKGCPPVETFTHESQGRTLVGRELSRDGVAFGYAPRRTVLDQLLVEAATDAGAVLREEFTVDSYVLEDGRIKGIRGTSRSGAADTQLATITVGADGRRSRLAATVQAGRYEDAPTQTCCYYSYWRDLYGHGLEIHDRPGFYIVAFPTNDGATLVGIGWKIGELERVRTSLEKSFLAAVDEVPELADRLRAARRVEPFYGSADLPNFFRKPQGPGWALVGDAGCHKDPILALGICDAFRDAEFLSEAIDEGLSGRRPVEVAMQDYEVRRNEGSMETYRLNLALAKFTPARPEEVQLIHALDGQQEETNRFFLAREGLIPPENFFNPENIGRIMANAAGNVRRAG